jgi:MSHA biogenesis protein MshI
MASIRSALDFLKRKSEPGLLAVVVRAARIDLARVRRQAGQRPQLQLADAYENRGDDAATLTALKRPLGLGGCRCITLLGHGRYQLIQTDAMSGPADEAREAARWKLKDQVEFPVETAAVDLLPIPSMGRGAQVYAVLAPEAAMAPLVQSFQTAGLSLAVVDLPETSQRNLAALFEEEGRALAMLVFDDDEGLLTFTLDGELLVVRHVEITAQQLVAADIERRATLFERIELDLQRSMDNFERMYSSVSLPRLLVAPIPGVDGFVDHLRANLTIAVAELDITSVIDIAMVPALRDPLRQFQVLRALGAALREEAV